MTRMAPSTAAEPAMSVFMSTMESAGLSDRPPESKVMALPTSARGGRLESSSLNPHMPHRIRTGPGPGAVGILGKGLERAKLKVGRRPTPGSATAAASFSADR